MHLILFNCFSAITLLEGKGWSEIKEEIKIKFVPVFKVYIIHVPAETNNIKVCFFTLILKSSGVILTHEK